MLLALVAPTLTALVLVLLVQIRLAALLLLSVSPALTALLLLAAALLTALCGLLFPITAPTLAAVLGWFASVSAFVDAELLIAAALAAGSPTDRLLAARAPAARLLAAGLLAGGRTELSLSAIALLALAALSLLRALPSLLVAVALETHPAILVAPAAAGARPAAATGLPVASAAPGLSALPILSASLVGLAVREVLAVARAPIPLVLAFLRAAVLALLVRFVPSAPSGLVAAVAPAALTTGGGPLLAAGHVSLLLTRFVRPVAAGAAPLLASLVGVAALVLALSSLAPLPSDLIVGAPGSPALVAGLPRPIVAVLLGGVHPAQSRRAVRLVARAVVAPPVAALTAALLVALLPAVLSLALVASASPVAIVLLFGVTAAHAVFRTWIVVRHSTGTESARTENGPYRSEQFRRETRSWSSPSARKTRLAADATRRIESGRPVGSPRESE